MGSKLGEDLLGRSDDEEDAPAVPPRAQAFLHGLGARTGVSFPPLCLAVLNTATYRTDNRLALRLDWPRIPLPASAERLAGVGGVGRRVAALLDPENAGRGGRGRFRTRRCAGSAWWRRSAARRRTWRWRRAGGYAVWQTASPCPAAANARPRPWTDDERAAAGRRRGGARPGRGRGAAPPGRDGAGRAPERLRTYWRCVPERVWRFTIGGYQVVKKWAQLPRAGACSGARPLTAEEAALCRPC